MIRSLALVALVAGAQVSAKAPEPERIIGNGEVVAGMLKNHRRLFSCLDSEDICDMARAPLPYPSWVVCYMGSSLPIFVLIHWFST